MVISQAQKLLAPRSANASNPILKGLVLLRKLLKILWSQCRGQLRLRKLLGLVNLI